MGHLLQDLQQALRVIVKNKAYSVVAIVVLALGIGANTAIFSVVHGVLLRPLPFPQADRLMRVWHVPPAASFPGMTIFAVSAANYLDWQQQNTVFQRMAIYSYNTVNLTGTDHPEQIVAAAVTSDFFPVLQVRPALGRVFSAEEDQPGRGHIVVLSHGYWKDHFGADPKIVGQYMQLDGEGYQVAGVMPETMRLPGFAQVWMPMAWTDQEKAVRGEHHYSVIARLKDGVDVKQAQAEMNTISARLQKDYPADDKGWGAIVRPLREDLVSDVRPALLVMLGAVVFVLLIACANVANLVLARILTRRKEIAIRTALGANRARILGHILSETVLLALLAGILGLVLAHYGIQLIMAALADKVPRSAEVSLNIPVLIFALAISVLTGVVAGLLPALRLVKTDMNEALKQGLGRTDSDSGNDRTRSALVVAEVALSLMLLIGAGLMIRSLWLLRQVDPGFDTNNLLTMNLSVSGTKFGSAALQTSFYDRVLEQVRAIPGVQAAGLVDALPMSGNGSHQPIAIEGQPVVPMSEQPEVDACLITPGYLRALRVPLLRGRDFSDSDIAGRPSVALISESLAKRFWPNQDPIGKHLTMTFSGTVREIVGVVGNVKTDGLDQMRPQEMVYSPLPQVTPDAPGPFQSFGMTLVARTTSNPATAVSAITDSVHRIDREVPLLNVATMDTLLSVSVSPQRLNMFLLSAFAGLAMLLAAVGTYSVLAYSVRRRVREIGIRMALGAQIGDVLRLILAQGMKPTFLGVGVGLIGALALNRVLANLVFGVKAMDPLTFAIVPILLAGVGFMASLIPAYRASRIEPIKTLRDE